MTASCASCVTWPAVRRQRGRDYDPSNVNISQASAVWVSSDDAREQGQRAEALKDAALEAQARRHARQLQEMGELHAQELKAARERVADADFLQALASRVDGSAATLEALSARVRSDRTQSETQLAKARVIPTTSAVLRTSVRSWPHARICCASARSG